MLRIGDIHINAKWRGSLIDELRDFVQQNPDEQHIVFLGDFVYHFNYDRKSLMALFHFFLELYEQGKYLYVLAGNHDWIADHFVYEEAKRVFDLLQGDEQRVHFITQPQFLQIEGQDCLFFPFTQLGEQSYTCRHYSALLASDHKGERLSGRANSLLQDLLTEWRQKKTDTSEQLFVFHHRYIVKTQFPGQWARFSYKSPGLDSSLADVQDIRLISGHMHQAFAWKNYLCTGSIRCTSPLEMNQAKYFFRYSGAQKKVYASPVWVNPYLEYHLDAEESVTRENLHELLHGIGRNASEHLSSGKWDVEVMQSQELPSLHTATLILRSEQVDYAGLHDYVSEDILESLHDIKLKRKQSNMHILKEQLQEASLELDKSVADWKTLLQRYLEQKFGDASQEYISLLQEIEVL